MNSPSSLPSNIEALNEIIKYEAINLIQTHLLERFLIYTEKFKTSYKEDLKNLDEVDEYVINHISDFDVSQYSQQIYDIGIVKNTNPTDEDIQKIKEYNNLKNKFYNDIKTFEDKSYDELLPEVDKLYKIHLHFLKQLTLGNNEYHAKINGMDIRVCEKQSDFIKHGIQSFIL